MLQVTAAATSMGSGELTLLPPLVVPPQPYMHDSPPSPNISQVHPPDPVHDTACCTSSRKPCVCMTGMQTQDLVTPHAGFAGLRCTCNTP